MKREEFDSSLELFHTGAVWGFMPTALITGGTGLLGKSLILRLKQKGWKVRLVSRSQGSDGNTVKWNLGDAFFPVEALKGVTHLIHLAGAGIADEPWTAERKHVIEQSRTSIMDSILDAAKASGHRFERVVSASGVGYYGQDTRSLVLDEDSAPGKDFLGSCCVAWERSVHQLKVVSESTHAVRFGVILSREGGAYPRLRKPVSLGVGAVLGSGKQAFPWIHHTDAVRLLEWALSASGLPHAINGVSPEQVTHQQFVQQLAKRLRRPLWLPAVPAWALKLALGERVVLLTEGTPVASKYLHSLGFSFDYPNVVKALQDLG